MHWRAIWVQRVSSQRFEQYVQRAILEPLGMWSSSFEQPLPAGLSGRLVASFPAPGSPAESFQPTAAPEGALSTTGVDMAAFLAFQLGHGPRTVLSASTLAAMRTPALPAESLHGLAAGEQMTLGLNRWEIRGQPVLSQGGDVGAFHSLLALFPGQDTGLFVSVNGSGAPAIDSDQLRSQLVSPFADRYVVTPDGAAPAPLQGSREHAAAVAGSYLNQRRVASTFVAGLYSLLLVTVSAHPDGTLGVRDRFSPEFTFQEIRPWLWREVGGVTTLAAGRYQTGRVTAIAFAGYASAGRVGFLQGHLVPYIALALALLVLVVTLVAWPIGWLRGRRRGNPRNPDRRSRLVRRLAYASAAPVLAGFGLLAASLRFFPPVIHPMARVGQALLLLGVLGVVPAAWHLLITLQSNRRITRVLGAAALTVALGYVLALALTFPLIWPPG